MPIDLKSREPSRFWPLLKLVATHVRIPGTDITPAVLLELQDDLASNEDQRKMFEALAAIHGRLDEVVALLRAASGEEVSEEEFSEALLEEAEATYLRGLARSYLYADFKGIGRTPNSVALKLDDIFVDLRMSREVSATTPHLDEESLREQLRSESRRAGAEEQLSALGLERLPGEKREVERLRVDKVLKGSGGFVLLGDPGSGKTALVKRLARSLALGREVARERFPELPWCLPIVVPLSEYDRFRENRSLYVYICARLAELGGELLKTSFERRWEAGEVLVCLDGLDEVAVTEDRMQCAREADQLVLNAGKSRVLITSRPVGYSICRLSVPVEHYRLEPFSPEDVAAFLRQWHRAYEQVIHPEGADLAQAEKAATALLENLRSDAKVASFTTNPLMLTLIALIQQQHDKLPERRVQLYELAIETLLESWHRARSLAADRPEVVALDQHQARKAWQEVAYWMHEHSTGTRHERELRTKLAEILERYGYDELEAHAMASKYLATAQQSGLLTERGTQLFAFVQKTFQEYLAANHLWLARPQSKAVDRVLKVAGDPRWHEVVRLCTGLVGVVLRSPDYVTVLVEALAQAGEEDPLEPWLCTHLRLALTCLADDVEVHAKEADAIVVRACERLEQVPYDQLSTAISEIFRAMRTFQPRTQAIAKLSSLVKHGRWEVRQEAARMLARVAPQSPDARRALRLFFKDNDKAVCAHAAWGLWQSGERGVELARSISRGLKSSANDMANAFRIEVAFKEVVEKFLDSDEAEARLEAVVILGNWGLRADVLPVLLQLLESEKLEIRLEAAVVLREWEPQVAAIPALLKLLVDEHVGARFRAAEVLRKWGPQADAIPVLLKLLEHERAGTRFRAAEVLGTWKPQVQAVTALLKLLAAKDPWDRIHAAELLGNWGLQADLFLPLLKLLETEDDDNVRVRAVEVLGNLDPQAAAVPALLNLLENEGRVRLYVAKVLGKWGRKAEAIPALLKYLEAEDVGIRLGTAEVLGDWGLQSAAIPALLKLLKSDISRDRFRATSVLKKWAPQTDAVPALLNLLEDEHAVVRLSAAEVLGQWDRKKDVVPTLLKLLREVAGIRGEVAHLLYSWRDDDMVINKILMNLVPNAPTINLNYEGRRGRPDPMATRVLVKAIAPRDNDSKAIRELRAIAFAWLWQATALPN